MTKEEITAWLTTRIATILQQPERYIEAAEPFTSLGMDSMAMLEITGDLASWLGRELPPSLLWEHVTIDALATHLSVSPAELDEPPIIPVPRTSAIPQTFAQERMWREYVEKGPDPRQTVLRKLTLTGAELHLEQLSASVTRLIERHEALRTTFTDENGIPSQRVHPTPLSPLEIIDFSDQEDAEQQAKSRLIQLKRLPFDLTTGPLARFYLIKVGEGDYRFCIILHHILCDGESVNILLEDLSQIYRERMGEDNAASTPLHHLTVQTADFASWQRRWLEPTGPAYSRHVNWWNQLLGKKEPAPACTGLRWENDPPSTPDVSQCRVKNTIPLEEVQRLRDLSLAEGTTLANVIFTAMLIALGRHGTAPRALIGRYVTDRRRPALNPLPGLYVNLVVMPLPELKGTFREALQEVAALVHEMTLHQDLPFEELVLARQKDNRFAPHPMIIINHRRRPDLPEEFATGLKLGNWRTKEGTPSIPWGMNLVGLETNQSTDLHAHFDIKVYDPAKVRLLMEDLVTLLRDLVRPVSAPIPPPAHKGTYWSNFFR